ncbi:STAS domain-containing protein [Nocardioides sp.]|uniref:STAS domain-containing protein n=1 Tax=Nocardioides sp. TaxID=35761 RepID=UPI002B27658A|nr:STAS domain-containing protein [Nocardioides sp.]
MTPGHARVIVRGEFDLAVAIPLRTTFRDLMVEGPIDMDVNLAEVTFIDSTALGVLLGGQRQARVFRGAFRLEDPSAPVLRLLSLTALDRVFEVSTSEG